jgi:hypothetical protein
MPQICDPDNLRWAFWRVARGKWDRDEVRAFAADLDDNVRWMRTRLLRGDFPLGRFVRFKIWDPKERVIHAPCFVERVLHHAMMNVCEPVFERALIADTYACRVGKGRLAAIRRAEAFCRSRMWFLKMDIRSYFPTIDQGILLRQLERRFKDDRLLGLFRQILGSYQTAPGKGLPIGALTSQHFANFYLAGLDRFVKEDVRIRAYVRYMDDFVAWSDDKSTLKRVRDVIGDYVGDRLALQLKPTPFINGTGHGMDFLGYRLWPGRTRLTRRNRRRLGQRLRKYGQALKIGGIAEREYQERVSSMVAFVDETRCAAERQRIFKQATGGVQAA